MAITDVETARSHLKNLSGGLRKGTVSAATYKAATFAVAQKQARADAAETKARDLLAKANARGSEAAALAMGYLSQGCRVNVKTLNPELRKVLKQRR